MSSSAYQHSIIQRSKSWPIAIRAVVLKKLPPRCQKAETVLSVKFCHAPPSLPSALHVSVARGPLRRGPRAHADSVSAQPSVSYPFMPCTRKYGQFVPGLHYRGQCESLECPRLHTRVHESGMKRCAGAWVHLLAPERAYYRRGASERCRDESGRIVLCLDNNRPGVQVAVA
jgi:hypothetical protein